ncbi:unnamed protein product [Anisakis simplex]|uniref:Ion_trans_2 domain-containing protein n=1 Tax=Anisakis simplex TaxID=6269 RepID=A0A0M3K8U3_ANISI|nr:unnamed protein product [Anisakis simplex]
MAKVLSRPNSDYNEAQKVNHLSPYLSDDSIGELEQYELEDHVSDIPQSFARRNRRDAALFTPPICQYESDDTGWDHADMLNMPDKQSGYTDESSQSDQCSKESDEESKRRKGLKKYAKLILPHVGLVLLTCAYTVIGALVFYSVEQPHEMASKRRQLDMIYKREDEFVNSLFTLAMLNETRREVWTEVARHHMHNMSDHLFSAFEKFFLTSAEVRANDTIEIWSFSTSIFFAVTVVTTIGIITLLENVSFHLTSVDYIIRYVSSDDYLWFSYGVELPISFHLTSVDYIIRYVSSDNYLWFSYGVELPILGNLEVSRVNGGGREFSISCSCYFMRECHRKGFFNSDMWLVDGNILIFSEYCQLVRA